jgi:proteasome lid subunit RPN8/RPN11
MGIRIGLDTRERLASHLTRVYPEEGCGVLVGRDVDQVRVVDDIEEVDNTHPGPREVRYRIPPEHLVDVDRRARSRGRDIVGFYHSHPNGTAHPSALDLEQAWPHYSYVIVGVAAGRIVDARSWRLSSDGSRFEPERLELPDAAEPESTGI